MTLPAPPSTDGTRFPVPRRPGIWPARVAGWALHVAVVTVVVTGATAGALLEEALRRERRRGDRGDVPGWVLVTLMTAGLVTTLWLLAKDRLTAVFNQAISSVTVS